MAAKHPNRKIPRPASRPLETLTKIAAQNPDGFLFMAYLLSRTVVHLICSIRSGADINVSDSVFTALSENLNDMNSYIKEAKAKGETVNMFEPYENYLNSLLE